MTIRAALAATLACACSTPAAAQTAADAFRGPYAGVEAGRVTNRFDLIVTDGRTGQENEFAFSRRGIGGGAFAGYDWAPADWLRLGVEAGGTIGGRAPFARFGNGDYARDPRFDLRVVGRAGVVPASGLMIYGLAGIVAQNSRERDEIGLEGGAWQSAWVVGGGAEYRVSDRIGLRLEGRHQPRAGGQIMLGIPIRF